MFSTQWNVWNYYSSITGIFSSVRSGISKPLSLQINGVDENGYCKECDVIKIQTDVFAHYLKGMNENNTLDNLYVPYLASYEFTMKNVLMKQIRV